MEGGAWTHGGALVTGKLSAREGTWTGPPHLHVGGQRLVGLAQAVPVLPAQRQCHARQAVGAVLGDLGVHCLRPGGVGHGEILIQQGLGHNVLTKRECRLCKLGTLAPHIVEKNQSPSFRFPTTEKR